MSNLFIAGLPATEFPDKIRNLRQQKRHVSVSDYRGDNTINNTSNIYAPLDEPQIAICDVDSFVLSHEHQVYLRGKYGEDFMKRLRIDTYGSIEKYSSYAPPMYSPKSVEFIIHGQEIVLTPTEASTLLHKWQEEQHLATISSKTVQNNPDI